MFLEVKGTGPEIDFEAEDVEDTIGEDEIPP